MTEKTDEELVKEIDVHVSALNKLFMELRPRHIEVSGGLIEMSVRKNEVSGEPWQELRISLHKFLGEIR